MPVVIESVSEMQRFADAARRQGKRIGVVPTMGALHEGHLSLLHRAARSTDVVVCTIFVNPTQFGPSEDFDTYPRAPEEDIRKAASAGATAVFTPSVAEMYAKDHATYVVNEAISGVFEGAVRPEHFKGVATIVLKLFTATKPHRAVFGQKDAQQLAVIRAMVRDLGLDIEIEAGPIVREKDGLAMSSRNVYLDAEQRSKATVLNKALNAAELAVSGGERSPDVLRKMVKAEIESVKPTGIDYIECVDPEAFIPLNSFRSEGSLMILAVRFGATRLLDNRLLEA